MAVQVEVPNPANPEETITIDVDPESLGWVDSDTLAKDYMSMGQHNVQMGNLRKKATEGMVNPDDFQSQLLDNEEFRTAALEKWEINPNPPAPSDADARQEAERLAQALRDEKVKWQNANIPPLNDKINALTEERNQLRDYVLESKLLQAFGGKVAPSLLDTPVRDQPPHLVNMLRSYFGYDDASGQWSVRDTSQESGFAYSKDATEARPYKGVGEFATEWLADKKNEHFLVDQRQPGAGYANDGSATSIGGGGLKHHISRAEAENAQAYQAALKAAEAAGATLVIQ